MSLIDIVKHALPMKLADGKRHVWPTLASMVTRNDGSTLEQDGKLTADNAMQLNGKDAKYYLGARNLLDNSDFRNPVNQRGQTVYDQTSASGYTIDRWRAQYSIATVNDGYVTWEAPAIAQYKRFIQWIDTPIEAGKTYTIAMLAKVKNNPVLATLRPIDNASVMAGVESLTITGTTNDYQWFVHSFTPSAAPAKPGMEIFVSNAADRTFEADIKCMAWYEGEYTAETLPPYVQKGYANELLACEVAENGAPICEGKVVNDFTTTEAGFVADARTVKELNDKMASGLKTFSMSANRKMDIQFSNQLYGGMALLIRNQEQSALKLYAFSGSRFNETSLGDTANHPVVSADFTNYTVTILGSSSTHVGVILYGSLNSYYVSHTTSDI